MNDVDAQLLRVFPSWLGKDVRLEVEISVRGERYPLAVGRPRGPEKAVQLASLRLQSRPARQVAQLACLEIQCPDVGSMRAASRYERQWISVRRECRLIVKGRVVGQALESRAIQADTIKIGLAVAAALGGKHNPSAVRRK